MDARMMTATARVGLPRKKRDENARALFQRAGNASVAVAVDTRPKTHRDRARYTRKGLRAVHMDL